MKITILQGAFYPIPPIRGGAVEKRWFELGKAFVRLGHDVTHVSRKMDGLDEREVIEGVRHIRIDGFDTPRNLFVLKIKDLIYSLRALRKIPDADIIVTNTFWAPIFLRSSAGKQMVDVARMPKGQLKLYRKATRFRANSTAVIEAILKEQPQSASRTVWIPNPLPFIPNAAVNHESKGKNILYVGRIHPEKGIHLLLDAFSRLSKLSLIDWKLDIVGPWEITEGGGGKAFKEELENKFSSQAIRWQGPIYDANSLNLFYARSQIFVYPSLAEQGETFGLAPLEAMAWGAIPIVSDLKCFKDFIIDGKNGFIFDHRDANSVKRLEEKIAEVALMDKNEIQNEALCVRKTHAIDTIAKQFIFEFEKMLT